MACLLTNILSTCAKGAAIPPGPAARHRTSAAALVLAALVGTAAAGEDLQPYDVFAHLPPIPAEDRNLWPQAWEDAFRARLQRYLDNDEHQPPNLKWVYEKSGGGFMAFLKGRREGALAGMRLQPPADFCAHTNGVDFFWCFHLEKQPRIYFQFGPLQPPEFQAQMKEGARLWLAEDPRPNLELVLQLECPDAEVAANARKQLGLMWRNRAQLTEMIAAARGECRNGQPANKLRFADYLEKISASWPEQMPADPAAWRAWWKLIAAGDWLVFEEYERRTNPRPHPKYGIGNGPVGTGWDPGTRGGWVDWRNTDNLRAMREVSVYLFSEETGNDLLRRVYKERIRRSAKGFFSVGNGEWDSPAYIGLTVIGYLALYDFAKDREVRLLAKGILDYIATATALKHFRAGASGPNTRDYGTWSSGDGGGGSRLWSTWLPAPRWPLPDRLAEMLFLSAYRPPAAVVALADGQHPLPCEVLATHPTYSNWLPGRDDAPAYHETQYRSRGFQMGCQLEGGTGDGNGGKIVLAHPERACDVVVFTPQAKGNPCVNPKRNERIAQHRNAWIVVAATARDPSGALLPTPWRALLPRDVVVERQGEVVFLRFAEAWAAVHPIAVKIGDLDPASLKPFLGKAGEDSDTSGSKLPANLPTMLIAAGDPVAITGFAVEVADDLHFKDFAAFKAAVSERARVEVAGQRVAFAAASGAKVSVTWDGAAELPAVERAGQPFDWSAHPALWQIGSTGPVPVRLGWKQGQLEVDAGGYQFRGTMDLVRGDYRFTETRP
ncbi:hypothetical protein LBMAG53_06070 [Planctomycetota bacterium]|nr:hypothetical protein LBMAG53_06070 [Planctomycetota bacterium]